MNCLRPGRGKEPDSTGEGDGGQGGYFHGVWGSPPVKKTHQNSGLSVSTFPRVFPPPFHLAESMLAKQRPHLHSKHGATGSSACLCFPAGHRRGLGFSVFSHFSPGATRDKGPFREDTATFGSLYST